MSYPFYITSKYFISELDYHFHPTNIAKVASEVTLRQLILTGRRVEVGRTLCKAGANEILREFYYGFTKDYFHISLTLP